MGIHLGIHLLAPVDSDLSINSLHPSVLALSSGRLIPVGPDDADNSDTNKSFLVPPPFDSAVLS